ncbi:MAG: hypothetical protein QG598_606, partial [Bacillota bacterium]|nr:hypothetical protein [Bacillota bacterium]
MTQKYYNFDLHLIYSDKFYYKINYIKVHIYY